MNDTAQKKHLVPVRGLSSQGFTLIELIIVMALFMVVIIISSQAFNKILSISAQQTKSAESDTQGVIGLEMMRVDLEHAGYGLPWLLSFPAEFDEIPSTVADLVDDIDTHQFNDKYMNATADANKVPRAVQAASAADGRDYLVIKSILAGMNDTDKKWTYVKDIGGTSTLKTWGSNDLVAGERVVTIDSRTKRLVGTSTTSADFSYTITSPGMTPPAAFQPQQDTDVFVVYGVTPSTNIRVPYNRVDYYVKPPASDSDMPTRCAKGTGILYKAVMDHNGGTFKEYPLLECVADMQVVFNTAADGAYGVDAAESSLDELSAKEIRQQLKMIKIYIVAHEGGRDTGFNYANPTITAGKDGGRELDLNALAGSEYKYYRWKTYKLVVLPKNINY